jgi:O-antigen/teichoic acid export membrane protein
LGIIIKQSFFSSVSAYIGVLIGYANSIILMPLFMSPDEIGLFRTLMSIAMVLVTVISVGMGGTLVRFLPSRPNQTKGLNQLFTLAMVVMAIGFIITTILLYLTKEQFFAFFAEEAPEVNNYLGLIIVIMLQMGIFNMIEIVFRTQKEIIFPNIVRDIIYKSLHVVVVCLYGFKYFSFDGYLLSHIVIYVLLILALTIPMLIKFGIKADFSIFKEKSVFREMIEYGYVGILTGLAMNIVVQIDQIMVTKYLGLTANGIYSTAVFMSMVIEYPRRFVSQISSPIMADSFAKGDFEGLNDHYKKASINQLILGILIFLGVMINLENIYEMMPNGVAYNSGWWVVAIIGLVKLIDMGFSLNGEIISLSKYYKYNTVLIIILSVLGILLNIVLIPRFGLIGAAIATLISYSVFNIVKYIMLKRLYSFDPFSKRTFVLLLIFLGCWVIHLLLPKLSNLYFDIVMRSAIITIVYIFANYYLATSELFNELLQKGLALIKIKI